MEINGDVLYKISKIGLKGLYANNRSLRWEPKADNLACAGRRLAYKLVDIINQQNKPFCIQEFVSPNV